MVLIDIRKGIFPRKRLFRATKGVTMLIMDNVMMIIHPLGSLMGRLALSDLARPKLDSLKLLRPILMLFLVMLHAHTMLIMMLMFLLALTPPKLSRFGW